MISYFVAVNAIQMLLNRAVVPTLMDMLDQPDNVDMVLPSVLAVIDQLSPEDYSSLVRHEMKKLFSSSSTSVQVLATTRVIMSCYITNNGNGDNDDDDYYYKERGYVFTYFCLSVCLFARLLKSYERILTKFSEGCNVAQGTLH